MNSQDSARKLQTKVFWIIWAILTVMILTLAGLFIYQTHVREVRRVKEDRVKDVSAWQQPPVKEMLPPKFEETMRDNRVSMMELLGLTIFFELSGTLLAYVLARYVTRPVEEAFLAQERFVADASHELKTPLAVITSNTEMLKDECGESQWLKNIQVESVRMNEMVKELLQLATTNYMENYSFENGNLSEVVTGTVLAFDSLAYEQRVKLTTMIESDLEFTFDKLKMQQLMEILLDNALKHTRPKGKIEVVLKKEKGRLKLEVKNQGIPIPQGDEEKIFERFYRSDKVRNRRENRYGLGLAIAKHIVQAHHGKITARSKDGWTEFSVILN